MRTDEGGSVREGKQRGVSGGAVMEKDKKRAGGKKIRWTGGTDEQEKERNGQESNGD